MDLDEQVRDTQVRKNPDLHGLDTEDRSLCRGRWLLGWKVSLPTSVQLSIAMDVLLKYDETHAQTHSHKCTCAHTHTQIAS